MNITETATLVGTPFRLSSHTAPATLATFPGMYLPAIGSQATVTICGSPRRIPKVRSMRR